MKRTTFKIFLPILSLVIIGYACSQSFLNINPPAVLSTQVLSNKVGVEALLVGAYSLLDGIGGNGGSNGPWATAASNWVYGSVGGGDAHKGSDPGDQNLITPIETWQVNASNGYLGDLWQARYDGVQRANEAIRVMRLAKDMTGADTVQVLAEARFLRGHYMFELKKEFGNVPWIDENITYTAGNYLVPNTTDVFPNIEADFQYAADNLPDQQADLGRANKWAATAYLAKVQLFRKEFAAALTNFNSVLASGVTTAGVKYALMPLFKDNFDAAKKNGSESVFAVQNSVNDNSGANNANAGDVLNSPYGGPYNTCCGFHQPSYNLVNAFLVDAAGLPYVDGSWLTRANLKNDEGVSSSSPYTPDNTTAVDPRLDWSVGRRGIPYLDWGLHPGADWIRNQASAGPYSPIKNVFRASQIGSLTDNSSWTPGYTAINTPIIRFSDVLLMAAEAEVEANGAAGLANALKYVNMVRTRASNPAGFVQGSVANYKIGTYAAFADVNYARSAIYLERKIELALEGHRIYDLVRWGTAQAEMTAVYAKELASGYSLDQGAAWTPGKNEYLPIPQTEIDLSVKAGKSVLTQNPGY